MAYISVKEAAQKWNISERLIQRYCIEGRIIGAAKFSGSWAIPEDAVKPQDPRKERAQNKQQNNQNEQSQQNQQNIQTEQPEPKKQHNAYDIMKPTEPAAVRVPMPLMNTPFAPGQALAAVEAIENEDLRKLAMAEYHYFTGRAIEAVEETAPLLQHPDPAIRLSACWIHGYGCLTTGQIAQARGVLAQVRTMFASLNEDTPPAHRALIGSVAMAAAVLLHLPVPDTIPSMRDTLRHLPPGLQYFALYVQAHQAYLNEDYKGSIGMIEAGLSMQPQVYPIPNIYLHLAAAMDYMSLKQPDKAKEHLLEAWTLAQPDDFIEPFGEHHGLLGGLVESVIKKDWPEDFKRIIAIVYMFSAGWRKIHNPTTGHDVADDLTTTEFVISMLAARDWTNQEIADQMGISPNTVKRHVSTALQKLNITQRKELRQYMLR